MTAIHERHRNSVKAGIFMTIAIILVLAVVAALNDAWKTLLTPSSVYAVTFTVEDGVQALASGSKVRIGGLEMGSVTDVQLLGVEEGDAATAGTEFETILVTIELDNRVPLYSNAVAFVRGALIGSDAWVEISSIGHPDDRATPDGDVVAGGAQLASGDTSTPLVGQSGGSLLASLLGPGGAAKADQIMTDIAEFTPWLANIETEYETQIRPIFESANRTMTDIEELANRIAMEGGDWDQWAQQVNAILTNAELASADLQTVMAKGEELVDNANAGVTEVRTIVQDNEQSVSEFIENLRLASADVQELADRIANDTINKIDNILASGQEGIDSFARLGADLEAEFDVLSPQLRDAMAGVTNAANQLALGTTEIRHSPWRLLYRPSTDELEYENLYFAATKFALAASELKIATQTMDRAIANHHEYLTENPTELEEMQRNLAASYRRYEAAQTDFLDILATDGQE